MRCLGLACLTLALAMPANAQDFTYRGFGEVQAAIYPQKAPTDDDRVAADARFRLEPAYRATSWLTFAGSFEAGAIGETGGRRFPSVTLRHLCVVVLLPPRLESSSSVGERRTFSLPPIGLRPATSSK